MIFQYENMLLLVLLVPLLGWWLWRFYSLREKSRKRFAEDKLWKLIAPSERRWIPYVRILLILLALLLLVLAAARPKGGEVETQMKAEGIDIYMILDLSKSMIVEDIGASRFLVQKKICEAIINSHPNDRIGIIGFTGEPYIICPLTLDHATLLTFLEGVQIDTGSVSPGTGYGDAILLAVKKFEGEHGRAIVLFTDGENNKGTNPSKAARDALQAGIRIYPIGIGTSEGARLFERDYFNRAIPRNYKNQPVVVKLDKGPLIEIGNITNGKAYFVESLKDANDVFLSFDRTTRAQFESGMFKHKEDIAHWFILAACILLIIDFTLDRFRLIPRRSPEKAWFNQNGNNNKIQRSRKETVSTPNS